MRGVVGAYRLNGAIVGSGVIQSRQGDGSVADNGINASIGDIQAVLATVSAPHEGEAIGIAVHNTDRTRPWTVVGVDSKGIYASFFWPHTRRVGLRHATLREQSLVGNHIDEDHIACAGGNAVLHGHGEGVARLRAVYKPHLTRGFKELHLRTQRGAGSVIGGKPHLHHQYAASIIAEGGIAHTT